MHVRLCFELGNALRSRIGLKHANNGFNSLNAFAHAIRKWPALSSAQRLEVFRLPVSR